METRCTSDGWGVPHSWRRPTETLSAFEAAAGAFGVIGERRRRTVSENLKNEGFRESIESRIAHRSPSRALVLTNSSRICTVELRLRTEF
jgi:hypothetical protein